jgi:DNA-binding GntR family transcriptional regulator
VAQLSLEELEEVFLMRAALEGLAARLGVGHLDDERIAQLQSILEGLNSSTDSDDWLQLNRTYHHTIYRAANRPRLFSLIQQLRNTATPYIRQYITSAEHLEVAREGHQQIFQACLKRDLQLAQEATQKHLEVVGKGAIAFVEIEMTNSSV